MAIVPDLSCARPKRNIPVPPVLITNDSTLVSGGSAVGSCSSERLAGLDIVLQLGVVSMSGMASSSVREANRGLIFSLLPYTVINGAIDLYTLGFIPMTWRNSPMLLKGALEGIQCMPASMYSRCSAPQLLQVIFVAPVAHCVRDGEGGLLLHSQGNQQIFDQFHRGIIDIQLAVFILQPD